MRSLLILLLAVLTSVCLAQAPTGLAASWPFEDEGPGLAADATGKGHDLDLQGVTREPGATGKALRFTGAESLAQAPLADDLQSPGEVTLEAWVRPDAVPPEAEGLGILNLGNVLLRLTRGTPSFHVFTDQWGPILAEGVVRPGQWYHLVGTYDGREMRVYVNGQLSGVRERTGPIPRCDRPLLVGRQANPFVGLIDEARVYVRRLTEEEVAAAFAAGVARLNPGVTPGRLKRPRESWADTDWHVPEPPPALAALAGAPVPDRPAVAAGDSFCAVCADIPTPSSPLPGRRPQTPDQAWRLAEKLGCSWVQVWPPPGPSEDWETLGRMLELPRPAGVRLALPLPMHPKAMQAAWARLTPHAALIDAVLVGNGIPTNPSAPLASWRFLGSRDEWIAACTMARGLVPAATKVFLARLPLLGDGAPARIAESAAALAGHADGLCVAVHDIGAPEAVVSGPLREAVATARRHGLELWLDASADVSMPVPLAAARMVRLLALCQSQALRLTWWPGPEPQGSPNASQPDLTPRFAAVQAWNRMAGPPAAPVGLPEGDVRILRWQDRAGRTCVAWWQADSEVATVGTVQLELPPAAIVVDPLHARLLNLGPGARLPLCRWPLLARSGER